MADTTETSHKSDTISETKKSFDVETVCSALERCVEDKNAIDLQLYLQGFNELLRFFHVLGAVFIFVAKDVESKISILEAYSKDEELGTHYRTIQSMIEFEKSSNLLRDAKRPSGSRTLLRLHRALEFISHFMLQLSRIEDESGTAHVARDCYKKTLAKFHPWYIQKSASLAMYTLPYRQQLVERAFAGSVPVSESRSSISDCMSRLSRIADEVYSATHKLYDEHDLHDLP